MALVYRAMKRAPDGLPALTPESSAGLGVRSVVDIPLDEEGFVEPGNEGMSVSTAPQYLPYGRRPPRFGGEGKHPVWELETDELDDRLSYAEDSDTKGFIEPGGRMELRDYQDALEETRDLWREIE